MNWTLFEERKIYHSRARSFDFTECLSLLIWQPAPEKDNEEDTDKIVSIYLWAESVPVDIYQKFTREKLALKWCTTALIPMKCCTPKSKHKALKTFDVDIIMPSTYFVEKMAKEDLLRPIDKKQFTQFAQLNPALYSIKSYDPNNTYSIPHIIGATGIGINKARVKTALTSWEQLWDPQFKDSLILIDDAREVFHIALLTLGYPTNTQDPKHIHHAYQKLLALIPNIKAFNSDNPGEPFLTGDINIGMLWSGSALSAKQEDLQY